LEENYCNKTCLKNIVSKRLTGWKDEYEELSAEFGSWRYFPRYFSKLSLPQKFELEAWYNISNPKRQIPYNEKQNKEPFLKDSQTESLKNESKQEKVLIIYTNLMMSFQKLCSITIILNKMNISKMSKFLLKCL